ERTTLRARHADGTWRWLEVDGTDLSDDPAVGGLVISFRDISRQIDAVQQLHEPESRFRAVVSNSIDAIAELDTDGMVTWCSDGVTEMLGVDPDDLVGSKAFDLVHPDDLEATIDAFADALSQALGDTPPAPVILRLARADSTWVPVEIAGVSLL